MSFLDQVEKIQKKPEHVRKKIVTVVTALSTGIIVIVWFSVANPFAFGGGNNSSGLGAEPFSMIKDIKDTVGAVGAAVGDFKDGLNEVKNYAEVVKQQVEAGVQEGAVVEEGVIDQDTIELRDEDSFIIIEEKVNDFINKTPTTTEIKSEF